MFLYDLTSWKAFRDQSTSLEVPNQNVKTINRFAVPRLSCLSAADYFKWIQQEKNPNVESYLKNKVLKEKRIFKVSESFNAVNIKIGEIFKTNALLVEDIKDKDCAKTYSAFQYMEGYYLIQQLVEQKLKEEESCLDIVFALPNDEWKYYEDPSQSFAKDVATLLNETFGVALNGKETQVMFYTFKFGLEARNRPYIANII